MSIKIQWNKVSKWHRYIEIGWTKICITKMVDVSNSFYVDIKTLYTNGEFRKIEATSWDQARRTAMQLALLNANQALLNLHRDTEDKAESLANSIKLIKEMR